MKPTGAVRARGDFPTMTIRLFAGVALGALLSACATVEDPAMPAHAAVAIPEATGVFAEDWTLPFHTTDFSRISDADYKPAFEQAMAIQRAEIEAIKANPAAPTFDNTIVALERSGRMLGRVYAAFGTVTGANTNDALDAVDAEMSPKLSAHSDAINLDPVLFERFTEVVAPPDARDAPDADDWTSLRDRLRYIGALMRSRQQAPDLLGQAPFTEAERELLLVTRDS